MCAPSTQGHPPPPPPPSSPNESAAPTQCPFDTGLAGEDGRKDSCTVEKTVGHCEDACLPHLSPPTLLSSPGHEAQDQALPASHHPPGPPTSIFLQILGIEPKTLKPRDTASPGSSNPEQRPPSCLARRSSQSAKNEVSSKAGSTNRATRGASKYRGYEARAKWPSRLRKPLVIRKRRERRDCIRDRVKRGPIA